jgi:tRNA(Ile)-lysidine synthase
VPPTLAQRVLAYIRKHDMMRAGDRLGVAVSGGADSIALLRLLIELRSELGVVLSVVHFNHKIRGDASDADVQFVRELAATHGLELHVSCGDTPAHAKEKKMNLEAAARELRYGYFESLMRIGVINKVATAHTLDDQAETVLLRIIRGTGTTGLAGIYPCVNVEGASGCDIVRPLLQVRRPELESYLNGVGQPWRDDATNLDTGYTRNRVRHSLLPLLERDFSPAIRDRLAELADIARAEELFWRDQLERVRELIVAGAATLSRTTRVSSPHRLPADELLNLPLALQRRLLRDVADTLDLHLDFKHVEDILSLVRIGENAQIDLPDNWTAEYRIVWGPGCAPSRVGSELILRQSNLETQSPPLETTDYSYALSLPGVVHIPELNSTISARLVDISADRLKAENMSGEPAPAGYNLNQLLDPQTLASELTVRNWRPGDRFWPAHTATPRKIKELLQQRHITGSERRLWPVVLSGDQIVWVKDFPVAQQHRATENCTTALLIESQPLERF